MKMSILVGKTTVLLLVVGSDRNEPNLVGYFVFAALSIFSFY